MVIFNDVKNKKEVIDKLINDDNSQNNIKHKWAKIIAFFFDCCYCFRWVK